MNEKDHFVLHVIEMIFKQAYNIQAKYKIRQFYKKDPHKTN